MSGDTDVLVGAFSHTQPLRVYDLRTAALATVAPWDVCKLYAAQFSDEALGLAVAGGVGAKAGESGEVRVFRQMANGRLATIGCAPMPRGAYSLSVTSGGAPDGGCRVAVAGGDHSVRVLEVGAGAKAVEED